MRPRPKDLSQLRIIAGQWRGRSIEFIPENIRPTPNRVRETLFNWLAPFIEGAVCLDLFAGSGALSFEALSRGASQVIAIDHSQQVINMLRMNAQKLNTQALTLVQSKAEDFLNQHSQASAFDIVFLDPPFHQGLLAQSLKILQLVACLKPTTYIYFEVEKNFNLDLLATTYSIIKVKQAGDVVFGLLKSS